MRLHPMSLAASAALLVLATNAAAQDNKTAGSAKFTKADYAVPDAPALKMLDVDASKILRPTSVKSLTASLASATDYVSFIPKAFAVEFSPGLLIDGENLSASDYEKRSNWYRTRFSLATKRGDGASSRTNIAAALRFTLQDKSDLRTDPEYIKNLLVLTDFKADSMVAVAQIKAAERIPVGQAPTEAQQMKITAAVAALKLDSKPLIQALKHAKEEEHWNDDVADMAFGVRGSSPDSTGKSTRFDGVAGWLTKGWGFRPNFQLLFGARGAYERLLSDTATKNDLQGSGDGIVQLYMGSNQYKVLAEAQATGGQMIPKWLLNAGGEMHLSELIWINASAGYNWEGSKGKFVSSFKVNFNPPGS
jgi:hypothetical protein